MGTAGQGRTQAISYWEGRSISGAIFYFDAPASGPIAVEVINHLGDEVMKAF
jgi:hypothetical protein